MQQRICDDLRTFKRPQPFGAVRALVELRAARYELRLQRAVQLKHLYQVRKDCTMISRLNQAGHCGHASRTAVAEARCMRQNALGPQEAGQATKRGRDCKGRQHGERYMAP